MVRGQKYRGGIEKDIYATCGTLIMAKFHTQIWQVLKISLYLRNTTAHRVKNKLYFDPVGVEREWLCNFWNFFKFLVQQWQY